MFSHLNPIPSGRRFLPALAVLAALPGAVLGCPDLMERETFTLQNYAAGQTVSVVFDDWPIVEMRERTRLPDFEVLIVTRLDRGLLPVSMQAGEEPPIDYGYDRDPGSVFPLEPGDVHRFEMSAIVDGARETGTLELTVGPRGTVQFGACSYPAIEIGSVFRHDEGKMIISTLGYYHEASGAPLGGTAHVGEPGSADFPPYRFDRITARTEEIVPR